ncbi:hypothetical protein [Rhodopirellula bahusiensis]
MTARQQRLKDFRDSLPAKYGKPESALLDACEAMQTLNRYAKELRGQRMPLRDAIYRLKSKTIERLFEMGMVNRVLRHRVEIPERRCRSCGGDGKHYRYHGETYSAEDCWGCRGTGVDAAKTLSYLLFNISLGDGQEYAWHQPEGRSPTGVMKIEDEPDTGWAPNQRKEATGINAEKATNLRDIVHYWLSEDQE